MLFVRVKEWISLLTMHVCIFRHSEIYVIWLVIGLRRKSQLCTSSAVPMNVWRDTSKRSRCSGDLICFGSTLRSSVFRIFVYENVLVKSLSSSGGGLQICF